MTNQSRREFPAGGGKILRRVYLLHAALMIVAAVGGTALLSLAVRELSRDRFALLPTTTLTGGVLALLIAASAAFTARSAVKGDTANLSTLRIAGRLALIAEVTAVAGGVAAVGCGAVLAIDERIEFSQSFLFAVVVVTAASVIDPVRRFIRRTAGKT